MGWWTRVRQWLNEPANDGDGWDAPEINPATGLPMTNGIDALGNPRGINFHSSIGGYDQPAPTPVFQYTPASASQVYTPISSCDPNRGW